MRLPGKQYRIRKKVEKERKLWRKRYFKKAARRNDRGSRLIFATLIFGVVFYLAAAQHYKELFFKLEQENVLELIRSGSEGEELSFLQELYKITFRLKTGEIIFYHEKTGENEAP